MDICVFHWIVFLKMMMPPKHSDYDVDIVENLNILLKLANPHTSGEVIQTNLAQRGEIVSFSLEFVACVNLCRHHLKMHHRFHIFTDGFYTPQIHKIISYQVQFTISVYFSNGHLQLIHPLNHLAHPCVVDVLSRDIKLKHAFIQSHLSHPIPNTK